MAAKKKTKKKAKAKRPVGKPRVVTDELFDRMEKMVQLGFPPHRAAMAAGINGQTLHEFCKTHPEYLERVRKAEAAAEMSVWSRMIKHSEKSPTACSWILERRWKQRWGREEKTPIDIDVNVQAEATAEVAQAVIGPPMPLNMQTIAGEFRRMAEITGEVLELATEAEGAEIVAPDQDDGPTGT